jgi:hypothetical protein
MFNSAQKERRRKIPFAEINSIIKVRCRPECYRIRSQLNAFFCICLQGVKSAAISGNARSYAVRMISIVYMQEEFTLVRAFDLNLCLS